MRSASTRAIDRGSRTRRDTRPIVSIDDRNKANESLGSGIFSPPLGKAPPRTGNRPGAGNRHACFTEKLQGRLGRSSVTRPCRRSVIVTSSRRDTNAIDPHFVDSPRHCGRHHSPSAAHARSGATAAMPVSRMNRVIETSLPCLDRRGSCRAG